MTTPANKLLEMLPPTVRASVELEAEGEAAKMLLRNPGVCMLRAGAVTVAAMALDALTAPEIHAMTREDAIAAIVARLDSHRGRVATKEGN